MLLRNAQDPATPALWPPRRSRPVVILLLCSASAILALAITRAERPRELLDPANLVYKGTAHTATNTRPYMWRSSEELFITEHEDSGDDKTFVYNLKNHSSRLLTDMAPKSVAEAIAEVNDPGSAMCVSPDGKWMAWRSFEGIAFWRIYTSELHQYRCKDSLDLMWAANSNACFGLHHSKNKSGEWHVDEVTLFAPTEAHAISSTAVPSDSRLNDLVTLCMDCDIGNYRDQVADRDNHICQVTWVGSYYDTSASVAFATRISVNDIGLASPEHKVSMPEGWVPFLFKISPSGKRIAWLLLSSQQTFLQRTLNRFFPNKARSDTEVSLWVSNFDGSNMKELGLTHDDAGMHCTNSNPAWLPDESAVSYIHNGDLFRIKVPDD